MDFPDWLKTNPYRPPNAIKGDEYAVELTKAVGEITHSWEMLEHSFQMAFALFTMDWPPTLKPNGHISISTAAMQAYGTVVSSQSRFSMLESAAGVFAMIAKWPELESSTDKILTLARRLVGLRNMAAHGMIGKKRGQRLFAGPGIDVSRGEYFITPAFYNTNKVPLLKGVKNWYSSTELREISWAIIALRGTVQEDILSKLLKGGDGAPFQAVVQMVDKDA